MKIRDILKERKQGVSFEFFPPKSAEGKEGFMRVVHDLKKHNPLYVSVTYGAGGSTQDSTFNALKWIMTETDLTVMSHLTCIGAARNSMDALLREYISSGIDTYWRFAATIPGISRTSTPRKASSDMPAIS